MSRLALHQQRQGCDVTMATVAAEDDAVSDSVSRAVEEGVKLVQFKAAFPRTIYFSWQMLSALSALIKEADVVHVLSNWTFPVWHACRLALKNNKKLVMTPHGCLSPERLAHSKWKKKLVGILDRYYLRHADVIHATCETEAKDINEFMSLAGSIGLRPGSIAAAPLVEDLHVNSKRSIVNGGEYHNSQLTTHNLQPCSPYPDNHQSSINYKQGPSVVVIPNGIDLEEFAGEVDRDFWKKRFPQIGERKVVLALGRLHPLKGLDLLVNAVAQLTHKSQVNCKQSIVNCGGEENTDNLQLTTHNLQKAESIKDWILLIAGPDEQGTLEQLKSLVEELKLEDDVLFAGAISGAERKDAIGSVQYLALPSRHENFGLTAAEALACRVPVIASKGTPWAELLGNPATLSCKSSVVNGKENYNSQFTTHNLHLAASGRAGWWVEVGVEPLAAALHEALALSGEERAQMGLNGRQLVERKFQWKKVAEQLLAVYCDH